MDIKILVATHKKYWMPDDDIYLPIQVGAYNKEDLGYIRDNTGDNISSKNPNYCELTALYWAWKNLNCEYIGLCHYRRYFAYKVNKYSLKTRTSVIYTYKDYKNLLSKYDIILPTLKNLNMSVNAHYEHYHQIEDLLYAKKILLKLYPEYTSNYNKIMKAHTLYCFNMFVMKNTLFNEYCSWLFPILFELEKILKINSYSSYQARVFGFLSERLFNIWLDNKSLNIYEAPVLFFKESNKKNFLNKICNNFKKIYE